MMRYWGILACECRIWDLSLERDAEEEAQYQAQLKQKQAEAPDDLPPQLLFVHQVMILIRLSQSYLP